MRARELHQHRPVGGRRDELGGGPQIRGAGRCRGVDRDAGAAQEIREKRRCRRLPGRPRDAHGGNRRPLEHEVGRGTGRPCPARAGARPAARSPASRRRGTPRRASPGSLSRLARARTSTPEARSSSACCDASPGPASVTRWPSRAKRPGESDCVAVEPLDEDRRRHERRGRGGAADPTPAGRRGLCTSRGARGQRLPESGRGAQRVCGNPRSTALVAGSGQRDVTTLPRV